jgi:3-deoxy-D-manno-octulosonic-acid transferase
VMGPHTFNFAEAAELAEASGAAVRVADVDAGLAAALRMLADPAGLRATSAEATAFAAQHRGAAARMAEAIQALLQPKSRP